MDENKNASNGDTQDNVNNWGGFAGIKPNDGTEAQNNQNATIDNSSHMNNSTASNDVNSNENLSSNVIHQENTIVVEDKPNSVPNVDENAKVNNPQENFEVVPPKYEEVEIKKTAAAVRTDSYFDGKLLELFGWTILKNLITIITLGIAGPWGECMMLQFEIEHTVLNGKRLKFKGTGGSLFVEKFKWIFFTIITLGIYSFWIPVKKTKWILSNVHFEDEEYVKEESYFDGKLIQLIGINILCNFLNFISFFILYPFTECIKLRWIAKHSVINRKKIVFDGKGLGLFGHYILWLFLTAITFGIYGFWLKIKMIKWKVKNSRLKLAGEEEKKDHSIFIMILVFIVLFIVSLVLLISNPFNINVENLGNLFTGNSATTQEPLNDMYCDGYGCYSIDTNYYNYYNY